MATERFDVFRPHFQPAQLIYDAIVAESNNRKGVPLDIWIQRERENVWRVARDYAQQNGLRVPMIEEIEREETSACGHVDYAAKWAYGVSVLLRKDV